MFVFCSLFCQRFLDKPRADSRQILHAGVLWFPMCLLSFWGLVAPGGRKKGEIFSLLWESMGNFCILAVFERCLSNAWTDPDQILFVYGQCLPTCPLSLWGPSAPGGAGGELKTKKWGVVSFVHRTATISIFLSVAKCGPICKAQTCAHSGVEPSRSAKAFLQGGPKSSKKFRIFHNFETLRPYISETIKNRGT